jgi:hypothetical protein
MSPRSFVPIRTNVESVHLSPGLPTFLLRNVMIFSSIQTNGVTKELRRYGCLCDPSKEAAVFTRVPCLSANAAADYTKLNFLQMFVCTLPTLLHVSSLPARRNHKIKIKILVFD